MHPYTLEGPNIDLFAGLSHEDVSGLLQQAQRRRVPAGTLLFGESLPAHTVHVITTGFVKMVQTTAEGARVIIRYVRPGEVIGNRRW